MIGVRQNDNGASQALRRVAAIAAVAVLSLFAQPAMGRTLPPADKDIEAAIIKALNDDPVLEGGNVGVVVAQGIATLQGLARDLRDKDRAERLASRIRGVRAIINSIKMPAVKRDAAAIAADVRAALASEPITRNSALAVAARGGKVTLTGDVSSLTQRKGAYLVASGVRGVLGVDIGAINVVPETARTDSELEHEIVARLGWNVWTADSDLQVDVAKGVAHLHGNVPSLWVRDLAVELASLPGVRDVSAGGIQVTPENGSRMKRIDPPAYTDRDLAEAIDRALLYDREVIASDIDIRVRDGKVDLAGTVPTLAQREEASKVAHDTIGVRQVKNEIAIRTEDAPTDERLVQLVKARLARAPAFVENSSIGVIVQAGIVTLLGTVESLYEKQRAEALAKREVGVTGVINKLRLARRG